MLAAALDTLVLAALTASLLSMQRLGGRTLQSLTALAGSGAIISIAALVPVYWLVAVEHSGADNSVPVLLLVGMVIWSIAVMAHILRHALSSGPVVALVVAVMFYWLAVVIRNAAFPPA
jgi:hypothetical protein